MVSPRCGGFGLRARAPMADVVPSKITSAPKPARPSILIFGAVVGMTTTAGAPRARAASATAWP